MQATGALMPLARFRISHLWLAFASSDKRAAAMGLSIPGIVGEDLRPWVPKEHSLVISSGQLADQDSSVGAASFLTMDWAASAGMAEQEVKVRRAVSTPASELCRLPASQPAGSMLGASRFDAPAHAGCCLRAVSMAALKVHHNVACCLSCSRPDGK